MGRRIILDWGTSSFRAALVDDAGAVFASREAPKGVRFVDAGGFEPVLRAEIGAWLDAHGPLPVYAAGMIGSRNGWVEVPYVPCPAGPGDLARGVHRFVLEDGLEVNLLPGVAWHRPGGAPDVMRGEETQIVGLDISSSAAVVLPGTHSKWVRVEDGRIAAFQSFVTGELFGLLADHSFVAVLRAGGGGETDWRGFEDGAAAGLETAAADGGLLARLFGVRTRGLFGTLALEATRDFLSGLLIGSEVREAGAAGWIDRSGPVIIVASADLADRYRRVADLAGYVATVAGGDPGIRGALAIARHREDPVHDLR